MNNSKIGRRTFLQGVGFAALGAAALTTLALPAAQQKNIDDFFGDFTADWIRHDPELAIRTRYFSGAEQDRLERQLTPRTLAWKRERIQLAQNGQAAHFASSEGHKSAIPYDYF